MTQRNTGAPPPPLTTSNRVKIADVIAATCKASGYTRHELTSPRRSRRIVLWRQSAIEVAGQLTGRSLTQIGMIFGRDHSTVLHSRFAVARRISLGCEDTRNMLDAICDVIDGRHADPVDVVVADPLPVVQVAAAKTLRQDDDPRGTAPFSRGWFIENDRRYLAAVAEAHPDRVLHAGD